MRKKTSLPTTKVIDLGVMSTAQWPGGVSARQRKASDIEQAMADVDRYYIAVDPKAKTRCIDGRHDPKLDEHSLGPQVPGGAPGAALAYRLGVDKDDLTRGTFVADAEAMIDEFLRLSLSPGGHRDAAHDGLHGVGCGAIDGLEMILATLINPRYIEDHKRIVKLLLGDAYIRDDYLRVLGAATVISSRSEEYFAGREAVLDMLEKRYKGSTSTLEGVHNEGLVIINKVAGSTFSSNRFAGDHMGLQAFGYDMWRSMQIAERLLPLPDQARDRERFVMARVMASVSTLMALTDGSLRLLMRV